MSVWQVAFIICGNILSGCVGALIMWWIVLHLGSDEEYGTVPTKRQPSRATAKAVMRQPAKEVADECRIPAETATRSHARSRTAPGR